MIPNIVEGGDTGGLMRYLVGPGRANEHVNAHVVGGSREIVSKWGDWETLSLGQAGEIADRLDSYMHETGTFPVGKVRRFNPASGRVEWNGKVEANHVWHCSLALSPQEAALGDEVWGRLASDFMDEMGFTGADGKAPCRWVAIHHGMSKGGGDHIHIAATIVREDGTKWSPWYDQRKAQKACNMLEHRYGLMVVESREHQRGSRCDDARAHNAARRAGAARTDRAILEERLRAAATAACSEADFVRRARALGVRLHPRFAHGRTDVVVGYSAALPTSGGQRPHWWGGGRIARDLTLTQLRTRWEDTPTSAIEAARAWTGRHLPHANVPGVVAWEERLRALEGFRVRLASLDPSDRVGVANAASDIAGLLYAQSLSASTVRGREMLRRAATQVGRAAQLKDRPSDKRLGDAGVRAACDWVMSMEAATHPRLALLALAAASSDFVRALARVHEASGQAYTAAAILRDAREVCEHVNAHPASLLAPTAAFERLQHTPVPLQREVVPPPPPSSSSPREDSALVREAQAFADGQWEHSRGLVAASGMTMSPRQGAPRPTQGRPRDMFGGLGGPAVTTREGASVPSQGEGASVSSREDVARRAREAARQAAHQHTTIHRGPAL